MTTQEGRGKGRSSRRQQGAGEAAQAEQRAEGSQAGRRQPGAGEAGQAEQRAEGRQAGRRQQGAGEAGQAEQRAEGRQAGRRPPGAEGAALRPPSAGQPARGERGAPAPTAPPPPPQVRVVPTLLTRYRQRVVPGLCQEFGYPNKLQAPRVVKVVLNIGLGEALTNANAVERATHDLALIAGQQPVVTRAKKDIAGFKLRAGQPIGAKVTLRGDRMYSFLERLLSASLPRIRDFRGTPRDAFDGRGNYSLGIQEHIIFPEIEYGQIDRIRGLQVNITTDAGTDREAFRLLELLGMPFARDGARAAAR